MLLFFCSISACQRGVEVKGEEERGDEIDGCNNEVDTTSIQVSAASTSVSTVSSSDNTANLIDETVRNGFEMVVSFSEYDSNKVLLENRSPRNQETKPRNQDSSRKTMIIEDISSKAMVAIDGAGFDLSYMADDKVPTNMALMAFSDSEVINSDEDESEEMILNSENVQHKPAQANQPRNVSQNPRKNITTWNELKTQKLGVSMIQKPVLENVEKGTVQREVRPVWNKSMRTNHQNLSNSKRNFAPTVALTKSGIVPVSAARQSSSRASTPDAPQDALKDQGYFDSGCTRHMTGNISYLANFKEHDGGAKTTSWNEFNSAMASAIICLATNQKFNFSRYIILSLVKNIEAGVPFFMFPRFVKLIINHQLGVMTHHKDIFSIPLLTKKVFANIKRVGTRFSGEITTLFDNMLVQAPKKVGSLQADAQPIPMPTKPSTSKP
nr:hypothetical protein [Tanacetum cinerariifolium]